MVAALFPPGSPEARAVSGSRRNSGCIPHIDWVADRFAKEGYVVIASDVLRHQYIYIYI